MRCALTNILLMSVKKQILRRRKRLRVRLRECLVMMSRRVIVIPRGIEHSSTSTIRLIIILTIVLSDSYDCHYLYRLPDLHCSLFLYHTALVLSLTAAAVWGRMAPLLLFYWYFSCSKIIPFLVMRVHIDFLAGHTHRREMVWHLV